MTLWEQPKVVIVGGGFAGLWAARTLSQQQADVQVVNSNNYHTFLPLVYQVAAAELEPEEIAYPLRSIFRKWLNVRFSMGEVKSVDLSARTVKTEDGVIPYDYLVLATGTEAYFCDIPGASEHAFTLKTLEQAIALRNHILCCFERAADESDENHRKCDLTFTIVGGGSTGVEFAGALAELVLGPAAQDYPSINLKEVRILLLEASAKLLPEMPSRGHAYAIKKLREMGVEVHLESKVDLVERHSVHLADGTVIPTETVVWTAGVKGSSVVQGLDLPTIRNGRVHVLPTLQVSDHPEVFVAGDLAYFEQDGHPLPMTAPVAIQEGTMAAQNIIRLIAGLPPQAFQYSDKGSMATIGRKAAVTRLGNRTYVGFFAWLLWLGVHIYKLIGFRNRIFVLINWARDYFFYERAVRIILPSQPGGCTRKRNGASQD